MSIGSLRDLQPRLRELVVLLAKGMSLKEAAGAMGISPRAASTYAQRARDRLNYRSNEQMMYELGREAGRELIG